MLWKYPTLGGTIGLIQQFLTESCTLGPMTTSFTHWMPKLDLCTGSNKLVTTLQEALPFMVVSSTSYGSWDGNLYAADAKTGAIHM